MKGRRVVVTGLGAVSSIGIGIDSFMDALQAGRNGFTEISTFDTKGFEKNIGSEVRHFQPSKWIRWHNPEKLGRSCQFSVSAARMAIDDSRIDSTTLSNEVCGVVVGTTDGEQQLIDGMTNQWVRQELNGASARNVYRSCAHQLAVSVSEELFLRGEALTISTACAAGNYAIGYGYDVISEGESDFMVCGGADSVNRKNFAGFYRLGTIAPDVCRPFDLHRQGLITGEGAGMLMLESLESALERGARIYAEVLGYGLNCDAQHMVSPHSDSIADCMRVAHQNAGVSADEIDYISAHGTGTKANDVSESKAIRKVFGKTPPPTSSMKSMLGHSMGAASALSSIGCILALNHNFIPPTMGLQTADPECDLDYVPNKMRSGCLKVVQNNAFAFGGNNAIVIFKKWHNEQEIHSCY